MRWLVKRFCAVEWKRKEVSFWMGEETGLGTNLPQPDDLFETELSLKGDEDPSEKKGRGRDARSVRGDRAAMRRGEANAPEAEEEIEGLCLLYERSRRNNMVVKRKKRFLTDTSALIERGKSGWRCGAKEQNAPRCR